METPQPRPFLESLTWLRAFAAFVVVVSHAIRASEIVYADGDIPGYFLPLNLLDLGDFGVRLFFVLSGCTLFLSHGQRLRSGAGIPGFYLKRFMRIWPAYAFSMLVYLIFIGAFKATHQGDTRDWVIHFVNDYSLEDVVRYLSLTFNITGPNRLFNMAYWSLPAELQYYLLLPPVELLMRGPASSLIAPIVAGVGLYLIDQHHLIPLDRHEVLQLAYTFFGGVFLAQVFLMIRWRLPAMLGFSLFVLAILQLSLSEAEILTIPKAIPLPDNKSDYYGLTALVCLAATLFSRPMPLPKRLRAWLNTYGDISYSVYLFHVLFINLSVIIVVGLGLYGETRKLLFIFGFSLVTSFLFSCLTYRWIELPGIRKGRAWAGG